MRPVSGFERPLIQWLFVALGAVLIAITAAETIGLRRARAQIQLLRAADLNARVQQEQLENRLAHEQATRESLTLELARRSGAAPAAPPTLTLTPLTRRGAQPPDPTVAQPPAMQSIQLRLVLPRGKPAPSARYAITVRTWSAGDTVWQRSGVAESTVEGKRMVTTFIAGDVFAPGAYEVALTTGVPAADVASYEVAVSAGPH